MRRGMFPTIGVFALLGSGLFQVAGRDEGTNAKVEEPKPAAPVNDGVMTRQRRRAEARRAAKASRAARETK